MKRVLACPGDGMKEEIQPTPLLPDCSEQRVDLLRERNVAGKYEGGIDFSRKWFHKRLGLVIAVGEAEFGAGVAKVLSCGPSQAVLVGDADNEALAPHQIDGFHDMPPASNWISRRARSNTIAVALTVCCRTLL